MPSIDQLKNRARSLSDHEFEQIAWLKELTADERAHVRAEMLVTVVEPGDYVVRLGKPVSYWFGLIDGLLKMSNDDSRGSAVTFTGVAPGGWFGEGTVLKHETYRYNIQALRTSRVAGISVEMFHWLIAHSLGFNRFVMYQLNERLGQFIAAREIDRLNDPDLRVARNLASMFDPSLYPGVAQMLRITQQELAYLVGLSRQRVNEALKVLAAQGWISVEYGGLRVLDLNALRFGELPSAPTKTTTKTTTTM
ncbi:MAG: Crp/Fnr family transcriptional regulator [Burkholderiaceae bacterium]|jgi:CRP/FNR family transcriptional regulator, cyclic AMP receptor protein|nr:Crp/Fnr family transcriptional regulator [Burkholderiaceae bacterium]